MIERKAGEYIPNETRGESNDLVPRQKRYAQILDILEGKQLTAHEVAEEMHKREFTRYFDINSAAPRLTEMTQNGMVEPVGKKKSPFTGRMVSVYEVRKDE